MGSAADRQHDASPGNTLRPGEALPSQLHFIWFGEVPTQFNGYIGGWQLRHPDWGVKVWSRNNLPQLENQELFDAAISIAGVPEGYQLMSDIARYEILYKYGGIYVDADMECKRPVDDLVRTARSIFAAWEVAGIWANNAFLGAQPGHPAMKQAIQALPASVRSRRPGARPNTYSGPQFITPILLQHDATIFPQHWFYPYAYNELDRAGEDFPDSYAVHHWNNQRRKQT